MPLSVEAIVAVIALFVALPPTMVILMQVCCRNRSHLTRGGSPVERDLELAPTSGPATSPPQPSLLYLPWRTTSIRMVFEESGQRQLLEITRGQPPEEVITSEADVPLLQTSQTTVLDSE
ncbi:hypothetical protein F4824DRAFT_467550 [Ustulina deusta]|nr:hypothetical protein F4823DRAFT_603488 [Ustulina deusta]KAI3334615.1 hypothetical protein F4824DRAFT_467550 [Ustulina deusta]